MQKESGDELRRNARGLATIGNVERRHSAHRNERHVPNVTPTGHWRSRSGKIGRKEIRVSCGEDNCQA